jgi:carboxyl-terminal processing protease
VRAVLRLLGASVVVAAAFAFGVFLTRPDDGTISAAAPPRPDRSVRLVDEVREELVSSYYRWIPPKVLERRRIHEILEGLEDPYTSYLTAADLASLQERTDGTYSGIGLSVGPDTHGLVVTAAFRGPAREAGIRKGDVIVRIEGEKARDLTFEDALALIKGEEGTTVNLLVRRPGEGRLEFDVVRREVQVPPISAELVTLQERKVAYIRVFSFAAGASQRIDRATQRLVEREGAEAALLDLRDNPGGLLSEAVAAVSVYLEEGVVCRTAGLHEDGRTFRVTGTASHGDLPLVVLVNGGTASAAEIVAAALHDHDRAAIVGERTFGKASVQTIAQLSNGGALKLTTAKYVTPAGADITGRGIDPPVAASDDPLTRRDEALQLARQSVLDLLAED